MSDNFTREVIKDALTAVGEEMFHAMIRTSMSPIIYESNDFAVGVTDAAGNLIAQGNGVTAFLAMLDTAVKGVLERYSLPDEILEGDVFITNNPYAGGGSHLSDVVVICPVFFESELIAFTVNKAHWTEVGGANPGSVSTQSTEIFQEGLQFDFLKLYRRGKLSQTLEQLIRSNVRLPESTLGDMHAGVAATQVGAKRIVELAGKYGRDQVVLSMDELLDYGERITRAELARLPDGVCAAEDIIEDDGLGNGPFKLRVSIKVRGDSMVVDFTGTDAQVPGPINCSFTGLVTATRCIFKAITNPEIPANGGCFRALEVICPEGTLLSATSPAPVSIYYEGLIAAIDVVWKALAPLVPDRLPAGHQRSVGATFVSGVHPHTGELFVMGEPLVGGWGASESLDGDNGQFCCGNGETFNIPIELFESRYGLEVDQYAFHNEDGGEGRHRGGKGVVVDYRVTSDEVYLTYAATRTESKPWSLQGGREGSNNYAQVIRSDGSQERYHMCTMVPVRHGEVIRIFSATGGGHGAPSDRCRDAVAADLKDGYITKRQAREYYAFEIT